MNKKLKKKLTLKVSQQNYPFSIFFNLMETVDDKYNSTSTLPPLQLLHHFYAKMFNLFSVYFLFKPILAPVEFCFN